MFEKYRFEVGITVGSAALVFLAKLGGAHLYGFWDYFGAWMLSNLALVLIIAWINA